MTKGSSYLNPQDRILKSEQIGLSNHKNEYETGVLMGNWVEERMAYEESSRFGSKAGRPIRFDSTSVQRSSYVDPRVASTTPLRVEDPTVPSTVERELLFSHGNSTAQSFVTMNNLTYTDPRANNRLSTQAAFKAPPTEAPKRDFLLESKREKWNKERDEDQFTTTYKAEVGTQAYNISPTKRHTNKWGEFNKSVGEDYVRMDLRGDFPLHASPLVRTTKK